MANSCESTGQGLGYGHEPLRDVRSPPVQVLAPRSSAHCSVVLGAPPAGDDGQRPAVNPPAPFKSLYERWGDFHAAAVVATKLSGREMSGQVTHLSAQPTPLRSDLAIEDHADDVVGYVPNQRVQQRHAVHSADGAHIA